MDPNQAVSQTQTKLSSATEHYKAELQKLRTGRAHPAMLDKIMVEAYGQPMPLKAVGSVAAPEAQLLQITPFDPNNLQAIAEAIRNDQALGLTPTDDGRVVRINLPPMTAESRQSMVKILHQKMEEAMIAARNIRHDIMHLLAEAEKAKQISRDELARLEKQVDDMITKQKTDIELLTEAKEKEITTI